MAVSHHEQSTRRATSFTFTNGFSVCGTLLVVSETRQTSKFPVIFVAGETNVGERARGVGNAIATHLVTDVCYITLTTFMTCII